MFSLSQPIVLLNYRILSTSSGINKLYIYIYIYIHIHIYIYICKIHYKLFYVSIIMIAPNVTPINVTEYDFNQSRYGIAPRSPFSQIVTGPSGSGKGVLLQSMILDIYRDVFERIYVWSPSISGDSNWLPVKTHSS